jgi:hypothetical protein
MTGSRGGVYGGGGYMKSGAGATSPAAPMTNASAYGST